MVVSPEGAASPCSATRTTSRHSGAIRRGQLTQTSCAEAEGCYKACAQDAGCSTRAPWPSPPTGGRCTWPTSRRTRSRFRGERGRGLEPRRGGRPPRRFRVRLACPAARVRGCAGGLRVGAAKTRAYRVRAAPRAPCGAAAEAAAPRRAQARARAREGGGARLAAADGAVGAAGGGAAPLVRRGAVGAEQLEHLLGVLEAAALAEVDVLLVERHRLVLAAAELAQCLGA